MQKGYNSQIAISVAEMITRDHTIIAVNDEFLSLSGFLKEEIVHSNAGEVYNSLLRPTVDIDTLNLTGDEMEGFLFTKSLEPREVIIHVREENHHKVVVFMEKHRSRIENKHPYIHRLCESDTQGVAMFAVGSDIVLLKANQIFLNFLEYPFRSKESAIGKRIDQIVTRWKGSSSEKILRDVLETGEGFYLEEYRYDGLERGTTYWSITLMPIYENGIVKYITLIAEEITGAVQNKHQHEQQMIAIKEQKDELEAIINSMSDGLCVFDKDGNFILRNNAAYRVLGNQKHKSLQENYEGAKYFDLEGKQLSFEELPCSAVLKGEKIVERTILKKTDEGTMYFSISGTPVYDDEGKMRRGILCIRDITESESKNQMINQQKQQLEQIMEHIPDAMVVFNNQGHIIHINMEARKRYPRISTGSHAREVHGGYEYFDLENNPIPVENLPTKRAFKGERIRNERIVIKDQNKSQIAEINATPIFDENHRLLWVVNSHRDVTRCVTNQQKLLDAEKEKIEALETSMQFKDEFLYLITHEFRTPMAVVSSALQAIELICKGEYSEHVKKYLATIKQNTNRQLRLVNNLLDITRMRSDAVKLNMATIDIVFVTKAIVDSIDLYAKQKGVNISFESSIAEKNIPLDEEKYERILLNLLANALKFTPKQKNIKVAVFGKKRKGRNMICISVSDEGIGIPKDRQRVIFERFGQVDTSLSRQAEGTGLGLYLVKLLIDALEGEITLDSQEGKGAIFTVMLPTHRAQILEEGISSVEMSHQRIQTDDRLVQSAAVEFADIYF